MPDALPPREWYLDEHNVWHGPHGERVKAISGGQGFDDIGSVGLSDVVSSLQGSGQFSLGGGEAQPVNVGSMGFNLGGSTALDAGSPAPGNFWSTLGKGAEAALPIVKAGVGVAQIPLAIQSLLNANQQQKALVGAEKQAQSTAAPAAAGAAQLIPAAVTAETTGQLPPELEAQVESQTTAYKQQLLDRLVQQGMDPQTAQAQVQAAVDEYSAQLRATYAAQLLQGGTGLTSAALGGTGQVAQTALGQTNQSGSAVEGANLALTRLLASSS